jgi:hypothetical protein
VRDRPATRSVAVSNAASLVHGAKRITSVRESGSLWIKRTHKRSTIATHDVSKRIECSASKSRHKAISCRAPAGSHQPIVPPTMAASRLLGVGVASWRREVVHISASVFRSWPRSKSTIGSRILSGVTSSPLPRGAISPLRRCGTRDMPALEPCAPVDLQRGAMASRSEVAAVAATLTQTS